MRRAAAKSVVEVNPGENFDYGISTRTTGRGGWKRGVKARVAARRVGKWGNRGGTGRVWEGVIVGKFRGETHFGDGAQGGERNWNEVVGRGDHGDRLR